MCLFFISITLSYGGTNYIKFIGTLTDVRPDAGEHQRQTAKCTVLDWMDEADASRNFPPIFKITFFPRN